MTTRTIVKELRTIGESRFRVSLTHDSDRKSFSMSAVKVNVKDGFESCMLHEIQFLPNVHKAPRFSQKAATEAKALFEDGVKALTKRCLLLELKKFTSEDFGEPDEKGTRFLRVPFVADQNLIEEPTEFYPEVTEMPMKGYTPGKIGDRCVRLYLSLLTWEKPSTLTYEVSVGGV